MMFACWSGAIVAGLALSLLVGHFAAKLARLFLYRVGDIPELGPEVKAIPNWIVGLFERFFFTLLAFAAMLPQQPRIIDLTMPALVWIGLKMAIHWQAPMSDSTPEERRSGVPAARAMIAILASMSSLVMAGLGGVVAWAIVRAC